MRDINGFQIQIRSVDERRASAGAAVAGPARQVIGPGPGFVNIWSGL
jgi:hypothetical protein